jgi:hypothetical protein
MTIEQYHRAQKLVKELDNLSIFLGFPGQVRCSLPTGYRQTYTSCEVAGTPEYQILREAEQNVLDAFILYAMARVTEIESELKSIK